MDKPKVQMVASDQPTGNNREMTIQQAQQTLDYEKNKGLSLWSVADDDPNYILQDGKIKSRTGKNEDKDA